MMIQLYLSTILNSTSVIYTLCCQFFLLNTNHMIRTEARGFRLFLILIYSVVIHEIGRSINFSCLLEVEIMNDVALLKRKRKRRLEQFAQTQKGALDRFVDRFYFDEH